MKCKEMPQHLVSLIYGELDASDEKGVRTHLKTCAACQKIYEELESTSNVLAQWEDAKPRMNWVFVNEPTPPWRRWRESIRQVRWGARLALGIPAAAALVFLCLAVFNFRADYQDGSWSVAFSLTPQKQAQARDAQLAETFRQMQSETLLLVSRMIEESEYRQQRQNSLVMAQLVQDVEQRRRQDLNILGQGIQGLQRSTDGRFAQTSDVLNDLIKLTSYKLERK